MRLLLLGRIAVLRTQIQQPIATDRVAWSVCRSVCHTSKPYKNGRTDRKAVWVVDSGGPKEAQVQLYWPGGANVPSIPWNRIMCGGDVACCHLTLKTDSFCHLRSHQLRIGNLLRKRLTNRRYMQSARSQLSSFMFYQFSNEII